MRITIVGRGAKLTSAIESYLDKKISSLEKFFPGIIRANIAMGMETHHHLKGKIFFVECKLEVPGYDVFGKQTSESVYEATDRLHNHLKVELEKHKVKLRSRKSKENQARRKNKEYGIEE